MDLIFIQKALISNMDIYNIIVFLIIISMIGYIVSWFVIFEKEGYPGIYSVVPFLDTWIYFEIIGVPGFLSLIPGINVLIWIASPFMLVSQHNRSIGLAFGMLLFPLIFFPIFAFGKYEGKLKKPIIIEPNPTLAAKPPIERNQWGVPLQEIKKEDFIKPDIIKKQCPACNTMVAEDSKRCFICGYEFID